MLGRITGDDVARMRARREVGRIRRDPSRGRGAQGRPPLRKRARGVADAIFRSLLATAPGQPVFINAPDQSANPHVTEFVQRYGLSETFRTARMYNEAIPQFSVGQVYGATSLELG
jgi:hypothetical protein